VVLLASTERRVIDRNVLYKDSDHLAIRDGAKLHPQVYLP